jgi:DNA (cytosine-5)-methyltransferase 1
MGYWRAGYEVVGVDHRPQPRYPFEFHQADALTYPLDGFDLIHASPPCQDHSSLRSMHPRHGTGWILAATVERLKPHPAWIVENVVGPNVRMDGWWFTLCGSAFGLGVRRHRRFGSNHLILAPGCRHDLQPFPIDVTGHGPHAAAYAAFIARHGRTPKMADKVAAMGVDWMNRDELSQAIPPAYTEFIGRQLLDAVLGTAPARP